ncbi:MAG: acyltransferase, partial [Alphaproteobacteria bacterium]|nr:acyltransferase [Alphaproteobacteria bacterium]
SAVFDAYGRMKGSIKLRTAGILDVFLPTPTQTKPLYARWGDWVTLGLLIVVFVFAGLFVLKEYFDE